MPANICKGTTFYARFIRRTDGEVDRFGSVLVAQCPNKSLPGSLLGELAHFTERWLWSSLPSQPVLCESASINSALLMTHKAIWNRPSAGIARS